MADDVDTVDGNGSSVWEFAMTLLRELFTSPLNIALLGVCAYLIYKIFSSRKQNEPSRPREPELPRMKKRDFTLEQLREYDGRRQDGRILMAVNFKVFDVTRGKRFYGPDGPYGVFAGKDASRGLTTFSLSADAIKDEYDDLSDLNSMQMEGVREWEMQFKEKYPYIGRLLRPGEKPQDYSDTEDDTASGSGTPAASTPTKVPDAGVTHRNVPNTSTD